MRSFMSLAALLILLNTSPAFAEEEPFLGCREWCESRNEAPHLVDQCMIVTQREGFCGSPVSGNIPVPAPNPRSCETQYQQLANQCSNSVASAGNACNSSNNSEMLKVQNGSATNSTSIQESCEQAADLTSSARSALSGFIQSCQSAITTCTAACNDLADFVRENPSCAQSGRLGSALQNVSACSGHQSKVTAAKASLDSYATTSSQASNCAQSTAGDSEAKSNSNSNSGLNTGTLQSLASMLLSGATLTPEQAAAVPTFCQANPTAVGCAAIAATDCNDPNQAKTNRVCVCANSPYDPMCVSGQTTSSSLGSSGGVSINSSSRLPSAKEDASALSDLTQLPTMQHAPLPVGGAGQEVDGRQGSTNPVGQSSVGPGGKSFKEATVHNFSDPSGSTRGGAFGGGSRGFNGANKINNFAARSGAPSPSANEKNSVGSGPDLRKFLPGSYSGSMPPQGFSGSVGPDGITGPHSNNWRKIQNRYNVIAPTLNP